MPAFISPLDPEYISFNRAAALLAKERPFIKPGELMEMFKHALFSREFERPETNVAGIEPEDDRNLPFFRIEALPTTASRHQLAPEHQPQEYFAVRATTVAEVLGERELLPGDPGSWRDFVSFSSGAEAEGTALRDLARIPYSAYPAAAQQLLDDIVLAKAKLRAWMLFKGYELPVFLIESGGKADPPDSHSDCAVPHDNGDPARGRPRKAGWQRIEQLIRELHAANPDAPRGMLAFDAHKLAMREFDEIDLPSVETIARQMKNIFSTGT